MTPTKRKASARGMLRSITRESWPSEVHGRNCTWSGSSSLCHGTLEASNTDVSNAQLLHCKKLSNCNMTNGRLCHFELLSNVTATNAAVCGLQEDGSFASISNGDFRKHIGTVGNMSNGDVRNSETWMAGGSNVNIVNKHGVSDIAKGYLSAHYVEDFDFLRGNEKARFDGWTKALSWFTYEDEDDGASTGTITDIGDEGLPQYTPAISSATFSTGQLTPKTEEFSDPIQDWVNELPEGTNSTMAEATQKERQDQEVGEVSQEGSQAYSDAGDLGEVLGEEDHRSDNGSVSSTTVAGDHTPPASDTGRSEPSSESRTDSVRQRYGRPYVTDESEEAY